MEKSERVSALIDFPPLVEWDRQQKRQMNKSISGSEKCYGENEIEKYVRVFGSTLDLEGK